MEPGSGLPSRALLIGVSRYDDARLPPRGTACRGVNALRGQLSDPVVGLLPARQVTVILDPDSASDLAKRIADVAADTVGALLLCYVGHGVLSAAGRLYLAVCSTDLDRPDGTALAWDRLERVLRTCPARVRRVILDCTVPATWSTGRALVDLPQPLGRRARVGWWPRGAAARRLYMLTIATPVPTADGVSSAARDAVRTDLVGELVDLIRAGIPTKPAWLALTDLYPALRDRLMARDLPVPEHSGDDSTRGFPFTANAALDSGQRAAMVLTDATRVARLIDDPTDQASALADIAAAWAPLDPGQAEH